jgi:hypothetical protein
MPVTLRGLLRPFLQKEWLDFDPQTGVIRGYEYLGMSQCQIQALQQDIVRSGMACRMEFLNNGNGTLTVNDSTQAYTIDTWEIAGEEENVDWLSHPTIMAMDLVNHDMRVLRTAANNPTQDWDDVYSQMDDTTNGTVLERFYNLFLRGSTEFQNNFDGTGYVLKHTCNCPNRFQIANATAQNVSDVNVGAIYSTARLLTEVRSSGLWAFPLPDRLYTKLISIPTPSFVAANYYWGWKKSRSSESTSANNRVNIETHYTLAAWSTDFYPVVET